jgi:DNA-binding GntR family transcriptional regulator
MTYRSNPPTDPPPLPAVRRSLAPLREQVLDQVREAIIDGRLAPGARLIERSLIDMLGVSRTVVREALRQLESEGLVTTDARKGMVVRALTTDEARDLYAIRALLEGLAARLFVEHATSAQRKALAEALQETVGAYEGGDPNSVLRAKNEFYRRLFDGAGSETLSSMLGMLHARIWRWRALGLGHPNRSERRSRESIRALQALLAAAKANDAARAEAVMREESTRAGAEVMRLLEPQAEAVQPRTPMAGRTSKR